MVDHIFYAECVFYRSVNWKLRLPSWRWSFCCFYVCDYVLTFTKKIQVYFVMQAILLSMAAPSSAIYLTQTTVGCVYVIPYLCYTNPQPSIPHQEENFQFVSDDNLAVIRGDIVKLQQTSVSPVTHQPSILNIVNLSGNDPPRHVFQRHHHRFIYLSRSCAVT